MANSTPKKKIDSLPALIKSKRGNISAIARALKVDRHTVYGQIEADDNLKQLLKNAREEMLDNAEDKLGSAVKKGEAWAVCFTLKTQGQERGYIEKQKIEHGGPNDGPIQHRFVVEIVKNDSNSSGTDKDSNQ
jgi:hypothetical protein